MNRIQSEETKRKISESIKKHTAEHKKHYYCEICGQEINKDVRKKSKYCSEECKKMSLVIPTLIKYFHFNSNVIGTINVIDEYNKIKNTLYSQYWKEELTGRELAEIYNYPSYCNITGKIFKYLNIPTRSCKETNKLTISKGLNNIPVRTFYKHGWHTTWNNKEIYFRSSYELDYANQLDEQKIDYEVESLRIKYWDSQKEEYRCAIPDFYLPEFNTIVEIKSTYTLNEQEMKDKIKAYKDLGYNYKVILNKEEINL